MSSESTERQRQTLVEDFARAMGYDPRRLTEIVIGTRSMTVRGYEVNEDNHLFIGDDGKVAAFEHTYSLWSSSEVPT